LVLRSFRLTYLTALWLAIHSAAQTPQLHVTRLSDSCDDITFTPDQRTVAYSSKTGRVIQIVDVATRKTIDTLSLRGRIALAEDGLSAVIGSIDGAVWKWRPGRTSPLSQGDGRPVAAVDITPDGCWAVSASGRTISYWDVRAEKQIWSKLMPDQVRAVSMSADGARVLVCALGSWILDGKSGQRIRELSGGFDGALSEDGRIAVTTSDGKWGFCLWDVDSGSCTTLATNRSLFNIALRSDGKKLAATDDHQNVHLFDLNPAQRTATYIGELKDYPALPSKMRFLMKASVLAASVDDAGVFLFSDRDGASAGRFSASIGVPVSLKSVVTDAKARFVLADGPGLTALWDLGRGGVSFRMGSERTAGSLLEKTDGRARSCDFASPTVAGNGLSFAAVNTCHHTILLSGTASQSMPQIITRENGYGWGFISWLRLSPTGRYLTAGLLAQGEQRLLIWDTSTRAFHELSFGQKRPVRPAFDETEQSLRVMLGRDVAGFDGPDFVTVDLAAGTETARVHINDVECDPYLDIGCEQGIAVSADGRFASYKTFTGGQRLRDFDQPGDIPLPEKIGGIRYAPALSSDGSLLLYGNTWDGVSLYNVRTHAVVWKKQLAELIGFKPQTVRMNWSCGGNTIFVLADEQLFAVNLDQDRAPQLPAMEFTPAVGRIVSYVEAPDRDLVIAATTEGVGIFNRNRGNAPLVTLVALKTGPWMAVSPDGRFDTGDPERLETLSWVMPDDPDHPLPVEVFLRDYFEPKLLSRVLGDSTLPPLPNVAELNRNQPSIVGIASVFGDRPDLATVSVTVSSTLGKCLKDGVRISCESGIYDLRLYRDGQLVDQRPAAGAGDAAPAPDRDAWRDTARVLDASEKPVTAEGGSQVITFRDVHLPRRTDVSSVRFTAYAFNSDRIKSGTAMQPFPLQKNRPPAEPRAYIVTMGVNLTSAGDWSLPFAPIGARAVSELFVAKVQGL
jgi:WD40 repeat protein